MKIRNEEVILAKREKRRKSRKSTSNFEYEMPSLADLVKSVDYDVKKIEFSSVPNIANQNAVTNPELSYSYEDLLGVAQEGIRYDAERDSERILSTILSYW
ncbi:MAG: hypothetical protein NO482_01535 [Candidatus Methanomethylicia archaeon]|nr:hypothetical protein [Candidatus Methanomethylicia archaeon]